jgi:hypothetical protein
MKKLALVLVCAMFSSALVFGGETLDLDDPEDAVKAMQKVVCHLEEGKPATYWWTGKVYSRVPGEKDRLLFKYQAMNTRACQILSDPEKGYGFRMVSREALIYQDPKTGEIIHSWTNPWTGEELEVVHIFNDPVNSKYPNFAQTKWGPFRFPATFKDGRGWFSFEVPLFYTNPLGGEYQEYVGGTYQAIEMFNFFFDEAKLLDASVGGLDNTNVSWSRVSKWLPWMKMGDRAGQMMYNGSGKRVASWDELPDVLKDELRRVKPEYQTPPPVDDTRPNETSWTYFKKVVDAERAAAE